MFDIIKPKEQPLKITIREIAEQWFERTETQFNQWKQGNKPNCEKSAWTLTKARNTYEEMKEAVVRFLPGLEYGIQDTLEQKEGLKGENKSDLRAIIRQAKGLSNEIRQSIEIVEQHLICRDKLQKRVGNLRSEIKEAINWLNEHFPEKKWKRSRDALARVGRQLGTWSKDTANDYLPCKQIKNDGLLKRHGLEIGKILRTTLEEALREIGPCKRESAWTPVGIITEKRSEILQCMKELKGRGLAETGHEKIRLKTVHKALIKAMSKMLKEGNVTEITRDALVRKTHYAVGGGATNQAYIELKTWSIITKDGQNFTPNYQHYKENPPD
jgi:hypothetical protein